MLPTALAALRAQGLRSPLQLLPTLLWNARAFLFAPQLPLLRHRQPELLQPQLAVIGLESFPAAAALPTAATLLADAFAILTMNRNKRECVFIPSCVCACAAYPHPPVAALSLSLSLFLRARHQAQKGKPRRASLQQRAPQAQVRHAGK
jgi:hypothetical protein